MLDQSTGNTGDRHPSAVPSAGAGHLTVRVLHADGQCFRSWRTSVEFMTDACLITLSPPGYEVEDTKKGTWVLRNFIRTFYWLNRPCNLLEVYASDGAFEELYINVASPPTVNGHTLTWTDHELDVTKLAGQPARIVDQDEFAAAAIQYGYTAEFQARCHALSEELRQLAERWAPAGLNADVDQLSALV
jgi:protein associated with RNAse G/E